MEDTDISVPVEKRGRLSQCYDVAKSFNFEPCSKDIQNRSEIPKMLSGGGGLLSTVDDYNKFMNCLLRDTCFGSTTPGKEKRLMSQATFREMISNQLPKIDGKDSDIFSCSFNKVGFAESFGAGVGFGFGFSVITDHKVVKGSCRNNGEYGWGGVASTFFTVNPVEKTTCLLMTQLIPSAQYPIRTQLRKYYYRVVQAHK